MSTTPRRPITLPIDLIGPDGALDDAALSAIERSTTEGQRREPEPAPATPTAARSAATTVAATGLAGGLLALDQLLAHHGETLGKLTVEAGPLSGALISNWPIVAGLWLLAWYAATRWREHLVSAKARDDLAARHSRAQTKLLRLVALDMERVAAELGTLRAQLDATDARTRAAEVDLRGYIDGAIASLAARLASLGG